MTWRETNKIVKKVSCTTQLRWRFVRNCLWKTRQSLLNWTFNLNFKVCWQDSLKWVTKKKKNIATTLVSQKKNKRTFKTLQSHWVEDFTKLIFSVTCPPRFGVSCDIFWHSHYPTQTLQSKKSDKDFPPSFLKVSKLALPIRWNWRNSAVFNSILLKYQPGTLWISQFSFEFTVLFLKNFLQLYFPYTSISILVWKSVYFQGKSGMKIRFEVKEMSRLNVKQKTRLSENVE